MQVNTKCLSVRALGVALFTLALAASSAWAYTTEPGWVTNNYFAADATSGDKVTLNGDWTLNEPNVVSSKFAIDSTQSVFSVTSIKTNDFRKIIQIDADMDISDYYYADDLSTDAPNAIAGISLTTNEQAASSVAWKVLVNGSSWDTVVSGPDTALGSYTVRAELDYTSATTPLVRYSVKKSGSGAYTVLKNGDIEWFNAKASAPSVSNVCFCGQANLSTLSSKLGTTAVAEANYKEFNSITDALAESKSSSANVYLYQDAGVTTKQLKGDLEGKTYTINSVDGAQFTLTQSTWSSTDGTGVTASYNDGTLEVSDAKNLVAYVVSGDTDTAYFTLEAAFSAVAANGTVVLMQDVSENNEIAKAGVTLNLAEKTITKGTTSAPILNVTGNSVIVTNGTITGATGDYAAIKVSGAGLTLDDIVVTNNATSLDVVSGGTVTILGGVYANAIKTDDGKNSAIAIKGGYLVADSSAETISFSGNVKATGGKFTNTSKTTAETASIKASDAYKYGQFAVAPTVGGYTLTYEIVTNDTSIAGETKVWNVQSDSSDPRVEGVQLPDSFVEDAVKDTTAESGSNEDKQTELNKYAKYGTGSQVKKWEAYVLGIDPKEAPTAKDAGPCVKGVQDTATSTVSFQIVSPEAIKAKESGCDVKFQVEEYMDSSLSEQGANTSDKVDYTEKATIALPTDGKVRYYKLKMFVTTAK